VDDVTDQIRIVLNEQVAILFKDIDMQEPLQSVFKYTRDGLKKYFAVNGRQLFYFKFSNGQHMNNMVPYILERICEYPSMDKGIELFLYYVTRNSPGQSPMYIYCHLRFLIFTIFFKRSTLSLM
jgi:hypothetical protein